MLDSGIELKPLPVRAQSHNHWTSRDFPGFFFVVVHDNKQNFPGLAVTDNLIDGLKVLCDIRFLEWQYAIINTVRWNFFNKWETLWGKLGLFSDPLMSSCFYRALSFSTLLSASLYHQATSGHFPFQKCYLFP